MAISKADEKSNDSSSALSFLWVRLGAVPFTVAKNSVK